MYLVTGELWKYSYDTRGRLSLATSPSGEWMKLEPDLACLAIGGNTHKCYNVYINDKLVVNSSAEGFCGQNGVTLEGMSVLSTNDDCISRRIISSDMSSHGIGIQNSLMRIPSQQAKMEMGFWGISMFLNFFNKTNLVVVSSINHL